MKKNLTPGKLYRIYNVQDFPGHEFRGIGMFLKTTTNICIHYVKLREYKVTMINNRFLMAGQKKIMNFSHPKSAKLFKFILAQSND